MTSKTPIETTKEEQKQQIGKRIKIFREAMNWSQSEFAEKTHKDVGTISRWERGDFPLEIARRLRDLQEMVGVSARWLSRGEGDMMAPVKQLGIAAENVIPYQVTPSALDQALMESAILAVLQLLEARSLKLSPERTLAGILAVYEAARAQGRVAVTDADVTPLVRLLMA